MFVIALANKLGSVFKSNTKSNLYLLIRFIKSFDGKPNLVLSVSPTISAEYSNRLAKTVVPLLCV